MKFIMWVLGYGSSIVYTVLGVLVLVYYQKFGIKDIHIFLTFWNFVGLAYLALQGLLVQFLKGKNQSVVMSDIVLSFLPGVVVIGTFLIAPDVATQPIWWILWTNYLVIWLFDVLIFGTQLFRIFRNPKGYKSINLKTLFHLASLTTSYWWIISLNSRLSQISLNFFMKKYLLFN